MRRSRSAHIRSVLVGMAMTALVVLLTPPYLLHDAWSRLRRSGGTREIPRARAADTSLPELLAGGRPVVVEGLARHIGARPADLAELRAVASRDADPVHVDFVDAANPYFLYTGDYGRTVNRTEQLSFEELLDTLFVDGIDNEVVYRLFAADGVNGAMGEIIDDVSACVTAAGGGPTLRNSSGVWIGSRGVVTPLHHDAWPGILFQTEGRKAVTMFEPGDRAKIYFNFPIPVGSRWSRLPGRSAEADTAEFPRLRGARRYTTVLEPGDALYIPTFWAHEMEALTANVSIPLRLRSPLGTYLDPGFLRPAAEVLNGKLQSLRSRRAA